MSRPCLMVIRGVSAQVSRCQVRVGEGSSGGGRAGPRSTDYEYGQLSTSTGSTGSNTCNNPQVATSD